MVSRSISAARLSARPLGQKPHLAHEPTIVFWCVQGDGTQSTHSNAISFNACIRLRAWQRTQEKRSRKPSHATPSNAISETTLTRGTHSKVIRPKAFEAHGA